MTKSWLSFALKLAVSAALIWFLSTKINVGDSAQRLLSLNFGYVLGATAIFSMLLVNNTARWRTVMLALDAALPFGRTLKLLYIGIFFNQSLPSSIGGDAVRMYLARREGLTLQGAINGVMLERVAAIFGLIFVVVASQPFLLARIGDNPAKYAFPALAIVALLGIAVLMVLDRIPERFGKWMLVRGLVHLSKDTKRLFLAPGRALLAVGYGICGMILISSMAYLLARSLNIEVDLIDCLVLVPPVMLVTTIPISIAGWGVREMAMVTAFGFVGMETDTAILFSVLFGLANIVVALPGGLLWLMGGYRKSDVAAEVDPG
ncbi:MAG: flippase-like domain-containing protein [Rhodospirillales bacterium]|nr:flippase-like domain-containing protein [Rhodospirillales bacterium]